MKMRLLPFSFIVNLNSQTCMFLSKKRINIVSRNYSRRLVLSVEENNSEVSSFDDDINAKIDAFLKKEGELFDIPCDSNDTKIPLPPIDSSPSDTLELALNTLRKHKFGTHIFLTKFCSPLTTSERMNGVSNSFKALIRASITPQLFADKLRSSPFSVLLDWDSMFFTEGYSQIASMAFVNVALFFNDGSPVIVQFTMKRESNNSCWLVDSAIISKQELFFDA